LNRSERESGSAVTKFLTMQENIQGHDCTTTAGEENFEFCITVGRVTRTAGVLTHLFKGAEVR